jgi:hypothetical protein
MKPKKRGSPARAGFWLLGFFLAATTLFAGGTKGKVKKGVYYSPEKNFTVPVPKGMGMKIDDSYHEEDGAGAVSFHDDFGSNQGIHYMRIPTEVLPKFDEKAAHPGELLSNWLNDIAMPGWFRPVSPNSRVLHESVEPFENMEVLLAEVEIPGVSTMVEMGQGGGRRLDSQRGLVIFRHGKYIYMLTTEEQSLFGSMFSNKEESTKEESPKDGSPGGWTGFAEGMKRFYKTISFTD